MTEPLAAILMMQHLPRDDWKKDLPRIRVNVDALAYQALRAETPSP